MSVNEVKNFEEFKKTKVRVERGPNGKRRVRLVDHIGVFNRLNLDHQEFINYQPQIQEEIVKKQIL